MAGEVRQQRLGELEPRGPQAGAGQVRRLQRGAGAAWQVERVAGAAAAEALRAGAQLDDPAVVAATGQRRGEAQLELGAVGAPCGQCRGKRGRGVDDDQVARAQEVGQVARPRVGQATVAARDEHADVVARQPAGLGRRVGLQALGQLEGGLGAQAPTLTSASR
jgi:hypothetical protein